MCDMKCSECLHKLFSDACVREVIPEDKTPKFYGNEDGVSRWKIYSDKYKGFITVPLDSITGVYNFFYHGDVWSKPKISI